MTTIIALLINFLTFLFAFFLGRWSICPSRDLGNGEKKAIWNGIKKTFGKEDKIQIISPTKRAAKEEFLEEVINGE